MVLGTTNLDPRDAWPVGRVLALGASLAKSVLQKALDPPPPVGAVQFDVVFGALRADADQIAIAKSLWPLDIGASGSTPSVTTGDCPNDTVGEWGGSVRDH